MSIPNLIALLLLSGTVAKLVKEFLRARVPGKIKRRTEKWRKRFTTLILQF